MKVGGADVFIDTYTYPPSIIWRAEPSECHFNTLLTILLHIVVDFQNEAINAIFIPIVAIEHLGLQMTEKPSHVELSGEQSFLDIDCVRPVSSIVLIHSGQR